MYFNDFTHHIRNNQEADIIVPEKWGQGRATFGGIVAAAMYEKIPHAIHADRFIRSIMLSFVAPVAPGKLDIDVTVLRAGKSATQVQISAYQNDVTCAVMLASFGGARESAVHIDAVIAPNTKQPDEVSPFPFIPNLTPDFTQHFDYRFTEGTMPFMGSAETKMGGWIKLKEPCTAPISISQILALLDAWPPAVFSMLKKPTSGSSLTWTVNFIDKPTQAQADEWWQYEANVQQSQDGYSNISATLWDANGEAIALSQQTVSVFG